MMDYKLVLWDIDGTILNFHAAQTNAIRSCFKKFNLGECSDSMLADYDTINHEYWKALERGEKTKPEVLVGRFVEFFTRYSLDTSVASMFNDEYQIRLGDTICFYDDVMDIIKKNKELGIPQFAVTNGTKIAQMRKLNNSGLINIFDEIYISEDIGYEKPNPKFFEPVIKKALEYVPNITKNDIVIIGDSLTSDMQLANNVGIKAIWFNPNNEINNNLRIDLEIKSFTEI